jgi:DNA-binding LacI/PurR family transcriptional regulator
MADAPVLHPTTLLEMEAGRRALARNQVAVTVPPVEEAVVEEAVVEEAVVEELPTLKRRGRQPKAAVAANETVVATDEPVTDDLFASLDAPLP